jgi:hypothetical protein
LTAQNINANVASGASVTITVPNAGSNLVHIVAQGTKGTADLNAATNTLRYTANADASGVDSFTYNLSSSCTQPCTPLTSNTATVTVTITGTTPPPTPPGTTETLTVTSAEFRTDQGRWRVAGTDNVVQNQLLTIKNIGPAATPKDVTLGTATVGVGGAWALDVRGVTLIPAANDRVVAINTNANPAVTSQPLPVSIRR